MGDEFKSGGFMYAIEDNGEWKNLGFIGEDGISLSSGDDDEPYFDPIFNEPECVSFTLKMPWYYENEWYAIFTGRVRYTVPMLRRRAGKSHRGKLG